MAIQILRNGLTERTPDDAAYCPACKSGPVQPVLQPDQMAYQCQQICTPQPPLLPTFTCNVCGCVWQWRPEDEKHD